MRGILTNNELKPLYVSNSNISITSLSKIIDGETIIYYDEEIGHVQTTEIEKLDEYYDLAYNIYDESDEDDVLYSVINGKKIFRQEHQLNVLQEKLNICEGLNVLDYGCAKGTVIKRLCGIIEGINPFLFDVSQRYVHLWEKFIPKNNFSSYNVREDWKSKMDIVTSFFAFEHTPDPVKELKVIASLLKDDGYIYMIVPNMYDNTGDFIVADHIHHYSKISLQYLFNKAGLSVIEIDDESHFAAFIIVGKKLQSREDLKINSNDLQLLNKKVTNISNYWASLQKKLNDYESKNKGKRAAIYGAGVYGMFVATTLINFTNIICFIDQNPLIQSTEVMNIPVLSPNNVSFDFEVLYVGLNPLIAKKIIKELNLPDKIDVFYL